VLTITDRYIVSDQSNRIAVAVSDGWLLSYTDQPVTAFAAVSGMLLADFAAAEDMTPDHPLWGHLVGWAADIHLMPEVAVIAATEQPRPLACRAGNPP